MSLKSWGIALLVAALVRPLVLALAGWLVLRISGIRSPASRHAVWTAVLIGILILPLASVTAPHWNLPILPASHFDDAPGPGALPARSDPGPSLQANRPDAPVELPTDLATLALWLYCAGVAIMFAWRLLGWALLRRLIVRSSSIHKPWLRASADIQSPVVAGVLRPTLLFPSDWREWSANKRKMVLAHEFAHLRRHDPAISTLARLARCLFWFHPLVWWISRKLSELSELACDAVVLEKMNDPAAYSRVLLEFADAVNRSGRRVALPGLAMAVSSGIGERVDQLFELSNSNMRQFARPGILLAAIGLPVMSVAATVGLSERSVQPSAAVPALTVTPSRKADSAVRLLAQARPDTPPPATLGSSWQKWLKEDVAYIITNEELNAFNALQTDDERENFVEEFWKRRDPTPGTTENEFKEEHYRRIAYANAHYFGSTVPGWKTDRGRIYITFGPPDEIDAHPSGGTYERPAARGGGEGTTYPFEDWRYRHIEGIGKDVMIEFVDRSMNGEYRITMDPLEKNRIPRVNGSASTGTVTVEVTQERKPLVRIPFLGPMFQALVTVATPNGPPVSTVAFAGSLCGDAFKPGCLSEPFYSPDLKPLEPGTYILHAVVIDIPSGTRHSYNASFTVN